MRLFGDLFRKRQASRLTLEEKLEVLGRGGLRLEPPFTTETTC